MMIASRSLAVSYICGPMFRVHPSLRSELQSLHASWRRRKGVFWDFIIRMCTVYSKLMCTKSISYSTRLKPVLVDVILKDTYVAGVSFASARTAICYVLMKPPIAGSPKLYSITLMVMIAVLNMSSPCSIFYQASSTISFISYPLHLFTLSWGV